jgi:sucrose-6-phosphate hydrolase SacC (GH32 family)
MSGKHSHVEISNPLLDNEDRAKTPHILAYLDDSEDEDNDDHVNSRLKQVSDDTTETTETAKARHLYGAHSSFRGMSMQSEGTQETYIPPKYYTTHENNYQLRARGNSDADDATDTRSRAMQAQRRGGYDTNRNGIKAGISRVGKQHDGGYGRTDSRGEYEVDSDEDYDDQNPLYRDESVSIDDHGVGVHASFYSRFRAQEAPKEEQAPATVKWCGGFVLVGIVSFLLFMVLFAGTSAILDDEPEPEPVLEPLPSLATDKLRPQYHLLPPMNWMNDPCGPLFMLTEDILDDGAVPSAVGTFHLFYQCNPTSANWGNIHWCHATSADTIYWTNEAIAISPGTQTAAYPTPRPTRAPTLSPSLNAREAAIFDNIYLDDTQDVIMTEGAAKTWRREVAIPNAYGYTFETPYSYDELGVFSGSIIVGGVVNNSYVGENTGGAASGNAATATAFYTGVSLPYNVTKPEDYYTLKDTSHPYIEVQAMAASYEDTLFDWDKRVYEQEQIGTNPNTYTEKLVNPMISTPPSPFTAEQISGFRDPSVTSLGNDGQDGYRMLVGSGFMTNLTYTTSNEHPKKTGISGFPGGGTIFNYESSGPGIVNEWNYNGSLLTANHTLAQAKHQNDVYFNRTVPDPVDTDTAWECPDLFKLPVRNYPNMGEYSVLVYGSQRKVVYHIGDVVNSADLPPVDQDAAGSGRDSRFYQRGNETFISYVQGVLDMGYFYAARSQPYIINSEINNPNAYNNGVKQSYYNSTTARIMWGWIPEGSSRTAQQNTYQGWAGVMSLPRAVTLEYHENANIYTTDTTFASLWPYSYMFNEGAYIGQVQENRRAIAAAGLQLVVTPSPAVKVLRNYGLEDKENGDFAPNDTQDTSVENTSRSGLGVTGNTTVNFGNYANVSAAVEAVYNKLTVYQIAADTMITLNTTLQNFTLNIIDLQGHVFTAISYTSVHVFSESSGGAAVRQMLKVGDQACNCSSLFGYTGGYVPPAPTAVPTLYPSSSPSGTPSGAPSSMETDIPTNAARRHRSMSAAMNNARVDVDAAGTFEYYAERTPLQLRILIDASVVEVFLNDRCAVTYRTYQVPVFSNVPLKFQLDENEPGTSYIQTVAMWPMSSISDNRMTTIP